MTTWILILMLVGPDGHGTNLTSVPGFATWEACNDAGVLARGLPVLTPPQDGARVPGGRVDWVCVSTGGKAQAAARPDALDAMRAELREIMRQNREAFTAKETPDGR